MAFDNVRLPDDIERGAKGGPKFQTSIIALGNGSEQRNVDWLRTRASFDVGYGIQSKSDFAEIIKFFYARQGKARGFRFKDWSDYQATDQEIGTGDGVTVAFQLIKDYTSLVTYRRTITRPVTGSVVVKVDGVTTAVTVNTTTGVVTFAVAPALDATITASFEFDIPVRFDTDELILDLETFDAASIGSVPLIEILE
jgi:uncharacterized protein (TIGR02217 family)